MLEVVQFGNLYFATRFGCQGFGETGFVERDTDHVADRITAALVLAIPVRFVLVFSPDRVHDPHALAVVDVKILLAVIADVAQSLLGQFLRLLSRQLTFGFHDLEGFDRGQYGLVGCLEGGFSVLQQLAAEVDDLESAEQYQAAQGDQYR